MALPNYVKFQRGSQAAYNNLSVKDENTLYFIYNSTDQTKGSLYLGDRLISSNVGGTGASSLNELTDVITTNAQTGDFLVLNSEGNWIATGAAEVAQAIVEAGGLTATIDVDNNEFLFNSVDGKLELKGFSAASTGMIPVKTENGLGWQTAPIDLSARVGNLETQVSALEDDLEAVDGKIANAISNAGHLTYTVVESLDSATSTNVIYLYANDDPESGNAFDEFMIVNGQLEKIGSFTSDLSQYATVTAVNAQINNLQAISTTMSARLDQIENNYLLKSTFNAVVGDISTLNSYHNLGSTATVAQTIEDIYERLIWQEIHE